MADSTEAARAHAAGHDEELGQARFIGTLAIVLMGVAIVAALLGLGIAIFGR